VAPVFRSSQTLAAYCKEIADSSRAETSALVESNSKILEHCVCFLLTMTALAGADNPTQESILNFQALTKGLKEFCASRIGQLTGGQEKKLARGLEFGRGFGQLARAVRDYSLSWDR
jgi:hypothetical protein